MVPELYCLNKQNETGVLMSYSGRYEKHCHHQVRDRTSPLAMLFKIIFICLLIAGAIMGGLSILGAVIGLTFGVLALLVSLSPIIFAVWVVWLIFKAIII
jgi:hypothetical protein